jgi:extracellular factor (EF) 3-hydroxypalmitic acid methyl ester biosynthesis protein
MNVADRPHAERNGALVGVVSGEELLGRVHDVLAAAHLDGDRVKGEQVWEAMDRLCCGLQAQWGSLTTEAWAERVDACLRHPLRELVHQDPFTRRAFSKPKGYAGDAALLDYVCGRDEQWPATTLAVA